MASRVQNAGLAKITGLLLAVAPGWFLGWGTGTDPGVAGTDVTKTGVTEARVASVVSQQNTGGVANDTLRMVATITEASAGPIAITQVGAFDALTAGNMCFYGDFAAVNVSLGESITFTVNAKFA